MRQRHPRTNPPPVFRPAALLLAALFLLGLACGRKGDPRPRSDVSPDLTPPPSAVQAAPGR